MRSDHRDIRGKLVDTKYPSGPIDKEVKEISDLTICLSLAWHLSVLKSVTRRVPPMNGK